MSSAFAVNAQTNPFGFEAMDAGYQIVGSEGKCGEAKCGADMKKAAAEKAKEGKCGEAKCGAEMKKRPQIKPMKANVAKRNAVPM